MGYVGAHQKIVRLLGRADSYSCCQCGRRAYEWAYQEARNPKFVDERGRTYSDDPADYLPMCRSCHRALDGPLVKAPPNRSRFKEGVSQAVRDVRAKAARVGNSKKYRCNECPVTAHAAAIGAHQRKGHRGRILVTNGEWHEQELHLPRHQRGASAPDDQAAQRRGRGR